MPQSTKEELHSTVSLADPLPGTCFLPPSHLPFLKDSSEHTGQHNFTVGCLKGLTS